jgi:hypothetical protein
VCVCVCVSYRLRCEAPRSLTSSFVYLAPPSRAKVCNHSVAAASLSAGETEVRCFSSDNKKETCECHKRPAEEREVRGFSSDNSMAMLRSVAAVKSPMPTGWRSGGSAQTN